MLAVFFHVSYCSPPVLGRLEGIEFSYRFHRTSLEVLIVLFSPRRFLSLRSAAYGMGYPATRRSRLELRSQLVR